jgi:hypothetical protein
MINATLFNECIRQPFIERDSKKSRTTRSKARKAALALRIEKEMADELNSSSPGNRPFCRKTAGNIHMADSFPDCKPI